jgi:hypothetical protein
VGIHRDINNEREDCKIGTVYEWGGNCGEGSVNKEDEGEGIQLMDFIYLYEMEQ